MLERFCRKVRLPRANRFLGVRYVGIHLNFNQTHVILSSDEKPHLERTAQTLLDRFRREWPHCAYCLTNRPAILPVSPDSRNFYLVCRLNAKETSCISCTVGANLGCVVCLLSPSIDAPYRASVVTLNLTIQNTMACRAFRLLRNSHIPYRIVLDTNILCSPSRYATLEFVRAASDMCDSMV